jgi:hypothetical protein
VGEGLGERACILKSNKTPLPSPLPQAGEGTAPSAPRFNKESVVGLNAVKPNVYRVNLLGFADAQPNLRTARNPYFYVEHVIVNIFIQILKFLLCVFGGAVSASLILIVGAQYFYGVGRLDDIDKLGSFLNEVNPIVSIIGALFGSIIFFKKVHRLD